MNILIYTTPDTLKHKQEPEMNCWWELHNTPRKHNVDEMERVYFATRGFIRGYFDVDFIDNNVIEFCSDNWHDIKPIPQKAFRGFKYFNCGGGE